MTKLYLLDQYTTDPYYNLALERVLTETAEEDDVLLYLWQNVRTVVIGRNQNAWAECDVKALEADGGSLARRPSGGGAVYHDVGNLNFSFIATDGHYDVDRQLDVVIKAMELLDIKAERSGRNDLTVSGRKFSGNAFSHIGGRHCHHGTLMLDVDAGALEKYLTVSPSKLHSKGVASVRSRVCNLRELRPGLTVERLKAVLVEAFSTVYGHLAVGHPPSEAICKDQVGRLAEQYASWEWKFGRAIPFTAQLSHRFPFGELTLQFEVREGRVRDVLCYSDGLDIGLTDGLDVALTDCRYTNECLYNAIFDHVKPNNYRFDAWQAIAGWIVAASL